MSTIVAVTCSSCGGAVAHEAGTSVPRCVYCGSDALSTAALDARIEQPKTHIPFAIEPDEADNVFRKWARGSFWHPKAIRDAELDLERVNLAAWAWSGQVETHFAGLVSAPTPSGKRPITGQDTAHLEGVVVPSSTAISRGELTAIAPFRHTDELPYDPHTAEDPFEPGKLSRDAARAQAVEAMEAAHAAQLKKAHSASRMNAASVLSELSGRPVLLPVYVGAWRFKDQVYRVVINGQTGRLSGKAPFAWLKLFLIVGVVLAVSTVLAVVLGLAGVLAQ